MKKIETLQQLEAEVTRLKNIYASFKEGTPETDQVFFRITDVSEKVISQAETMFNSVPEYSNGKLTLQYRAYDRAFGFALFIYSVPVSRKTRALNQFSEA
jgi:hypothetical protein